MKVVLKAMAVMSAVMVAAVALSAKPETFKGTVATVDKARLSVKLDGDAAKTVTFDVSDKTKVSRAGKHEVFDAIRVKVGEAVEVTVNDGDAPGKEFRCPMKSDADVVSDKAGKCPKCGMNLRETDKAGKAAEIAFKK